MPDASTGPQPTEWEKKYGSFAAALTSMAPVAPRQDPRVAERIAQIEREGAAKRAAALPTPEEQGAAMAAFFQSDPTGRRIAAAGKEAVVSAAQRVGIMPPPPPPKRGVPKWVFVAAGATALAALVLFVLRRRK